MDKGIKAIEIRSDYYHEGRIMFEFVTGDDVKGAANPPKEGEDFVRSRCIVRVGDFDAVTGQAVTEDMITGYNRIAWSEIKNTLQYEKDEFTEEEKARREEIGRAFMIAFREEHGYDPSKDDVRLEMDKRIPERWNMLISALVEKENEEEKEDCTDREKRLSVPFEEIDSEEDSVEMQALLEVTANLTGRLALVWEAMYLRAAGGSKRLRFKDLADMWNVSQERVSEYRKKIEKMIRKRAEELRQKDTDDCAVE